MVGWLAPYPLHNLFYWQQSKSREIDFLHKKIVSSFVLDLDVLFHWKMIFVAGIVLRNELSATTCVCVICPCGAKDEPCIFMTRDRALNELLILFIFLRLTR